MDENHPHNSPLQQLVNKRLETAFFAKLEKLANLSKLAALRVSGHSIEHGMQSRAMPCPVSGLPMDSSEPPHAEGGCDACFRDFLLHENGEVDRELAAAGHPQATA